MKYLLKYYESHFNKFGGLFDTPFLALKALECYLLTKKLTINDVKQEHISLLKIEPDFADKLQNSMNKKSLQFHSCYMKPKVKALVKKYDDIVPVTLVT